MGHLPDPPQGLTKKIGLKNAPHLPLRKWARDCQNVLKYGHNAMLSDEVLFVDPTKVRHSLRMLKPGTRLHTHRYWSGVVLGGNWDEDIYDVASHWKYKACHAHFCKGMSWSETGIYEKSLAFIDKFGVLDKCRTLDDLEKRYSKIDKLYDVIAANGEFSVQKALPTYKRGEVGGVFGHVDRHGNFIRCGNGSHRFAIARCLGLRKIPVHVGLVHSEAVDMGVIPRMRERQFDLLCSGA